METPKPIGYWLKHLHNLLERQFEEALADVDQGLGRRHWQVLNVLYADSCGPAELERALAPFWAEGGPDLEEVLHGEGGLSPRGWIRRSSVLVSLTDEGYEAFHKIASRIERTRETVLTGLSAEDYAETIRVLSVMAANVERALRIPELLGGGGCRTGALRRSLRSHHATGGPFPSSHSPTPRHCSLSSRPGTGRPIRATGMKNPICPSTAASVMSSRSS